MVLEPSWMDSTRYNIVGKGPDPNAPNPEVWEMMRSLLADRFHMKYHLEDRETVRVSDQRREEPQRQVPVPVVVDQIEKPADN